jgi:hypothetical protein
VSTSADVVTRAMRQLSLIAATETPSAADAEHVQQALNAMIAGLAADGMDLSPDVPLPARHEEGLVAMLAQRIAPDFGVPSGLLGSEAQAGTISYDAEKGHQRLRAQYMRVPAASLDNTLINMPSQRYWLSTGAPPMWKPGQEYSISDCVQWQGRIYECTTAGTSATNGIGPEGYGASITDGTVVWAFKRVM